jgi:hypothetical protein
LDGLLRLLLYVWSWGDVTWTVLREDRFVVSYKSPRRRVGSLGWSVVSTFLFFFGRLDVIRHLWVILGPAVISALRCVGSFFGSLLSFALRLGSTPVAVGKECFGLSRRLLVTVDQVSPQHCLRTTTLWAPVSCFDFTKNEKELPVLSKIINLTLDNLIPLI